MDKHEIEGFPEGRVKSSQVGLQVSNLKEKVAKLTEILNVLENRLVDILREEYPQDKKPVENTEPETLVPLAAEIRNVVTNIDSVISLAVSIKDRIEL